MARLIFMDVDGTLIDHSQQVPRSAVEACKKAVQNGHTLILCTGRTLPELYPELLELGFDGIVSGNGSHVRVGDKVISEARIGREEVASVSAALDDLGAFYIWQSAEALYPCAHYMEAFAQMAGDKASGWRGYLEFVRPRLRHGLPDWSSKCTFTLPVAAGVDLAGLVRRIGAGFEVVAGSVSLDKGVAGELVRRGVTKGTGLVQMSEYLGVAKSQTVAIGDSANDLPMFASAGLAIAMGNATEQAKQAADWVAPSIDADGLAAALEYATTSHT